MIFVLGGTNNRVEWSDVKAADGFDALEPGDEITAVAGVTEIGDWSNVSRAVACMVPECVESEWDPDRCICTSEPPESPEAALGMVSAGVVPLTVLRDGAEVRLRVQDPTFEKGQRAGDGRKLKAGPELTLWPYFLGFVVFIMSLCVIGSHGLLSGTATMDFGGRRGAATAVGMIDGFVYLGTGVQSFALGYLTTRDWSFWPLFLVPFSIIGFLLALRIWNAKRGRGGGGH